MKRARSFWVGAVVGGAIMAYGIAGLIGAARRTRPVELATYLVGAAVVHDLVVAPIVLAVAAVVRLVVPRAVRAPALGVLMVGGVVTLFAFPFVRGYGRNPANPSALPGNYASGLVTVLVVLAVVVGAATAIRVVARARREPSPASGSSPV